jgi:hypothetical protein
LRGRLPSCSADARTRTYASFDLDDKVRLMHALAPSLVVLVLVAAPALPASAQPLAFAHADYSSAPGARAVVTADFNRDGWPDVAHAGMETSTLSILLNTHGEGFAPAIHVPIGIGAFDLTTGDFNRDGIPDLAVANADSNSLSILLGRGDGRFTRTTLATGASPRGITSGDFNKDGKPDLASTAYVGGVVEVLLGDGAGGFAVRWRLGYAAQPQGVVSADFTRDGHPDFAVAYAAPEGLIVWRGPAGNYLPTVVPGASYLNVLETADLNGDGWMDVAAASTDRGRVAIYLGAASGLVFARSYVVDGDPRGISIADVNADGVLDVITANRATSTVTVLPGDPAHRGSFLPRLVFPAGLHSRAIAVDDFNADGRLDLVTGNQDASYVSVLSNTTALRRAAYTFGRLTLPAGADLSRYREGLSAGASLGVADFNRDGTLDFVKHIAGANAVAVVLRDGNTIALNGPPAYAGHLVADVNDDGHADVLYFGADDSARATSLQTNLGNGRGAFSKSAITTAEGMLLTACVAGDVNGDRRPDLVCVEDRDRGAALFVLRGVGDGTFRPAPTPMGASGMDPQLADINRDGRLDIVLAWSGQTWLGDGNVGFARGADLDFGFDPGWRMQLADVNHDGYPDVISSYNGESLHVVLGGADGFHLAPVQPGFNCECDFSFVIADLNLDGNPDLLINSVENTELAGMMFVLAGRGDGTFGVSEGRIEEAEVFRMAPGEMLVADVTRDGLPDVVVPGGREIQVLVNQRNETNRPPMITSHDVNLTIDYLTWMSNDGCVGFPVDASDPDQHALFVSWRTRPENGAGQPYPSGLVGGLSAATACIEQPGRYEFDLTADDERGGSDTRTVAVITVLGPEEIVLHTTEARAVGEWSIVSDASAAAGRRVYVPNRGSPKVNAPAASPASYVDLYFPVDATRTYKLWLRLKADGNDWANDSVWVQFSGATNLAGQPAYRIGSTSGLAVNLEECLNCGESGWGWEDDGWGATNRNGVLLRFPAGGWQQLRIQTREDGVSIDQVVLSPGAYLVTRPGAAKNDTTILPATP